MNLATAMAEWVQLDYFGCRYSGITEAMGGDGIHTCMSDGPGKFRSFALGDTVRALPLRAPPRRVYVCIYVCIICIYMYIHMYTYIYMYIHICIYI